MSSSPRATTEAQKQVRRASLVDAAEALFAESDHRFEGVNVIDVARRAGVAKGTVYLYFASKEELFLALYERELERWHQALDAALAEDATRSSIATFLDALGTSLEQRPALMRLIAIVHSGLERNVRAEVLAEFREGLRGRLEATGSTLERFLRFLKPGQGARLLLDIDAFIIGLQHLADAPPALASVLARPEMALFRIDLGTHLLGRVEALLVGMAYAGKYHLPG